MSTDRIAAVLERIDTAEGPLRLAELADGSGWHPDHLARVFREHVGVSPARYQQHLRATTGAELLREMPVLDATFALGESSPARVHDLLVTVEAVTPGTARTGGEGLVISSGTHDTALGPLFVAVTDRGVLQLAFTGEVGAQEAVADVRRRYPRAALREDLHRTSAAAQHVRGAIAGHRPDGPPLPLLLRGTNLQLAVWRALLALPDGACVAYGQLAQAIGEPRAVRAVASAVGRNPVAPLVPCHRVLRANGALGGYRWGLATKRRLLATEAARHAATSEAA